MLTLGELYQRYRERALTQGVRPLDFITFCETERLLAEVRS